MGRQRKANGPHKTNRRPKQLMLDAGLREEGGWQGAEEGPVRTCGKPGRSRQASARCQRRGSRIDAARSHSCRQRWGQGQSVRPAEPSSEDPSASAPHKTWLPFPYLTPPPFAPYNRTSLWKSVQNTLSAHPGFPNHSWANSNTGP